MFQRENIFVLVAERKLIIKEAFVNFAVKKLSKPKESIAMNKLQEITSAPDYDSAASSYSKLIIAAFFASYVYMVVTSSGNPGGWVGPTLFLIVGLFASSILIAAPFFLLKKMFPMVSMLLTAVSLVVTFIITKYLFLWLLI